MAAMALLMGLTVANRAGAAIAQGPVLTNAAAAEERRIALFYQAEQSFQEKLKVGRERYQKRQLDRAKTIASMSAELEARRETVVIRPIEAPSVNPNMPVGWLHSSMAVAVLASGLLGFVSFLNRDRLQEMIMPDLEPLEPEPPVIIIPIAEQIFLCEGEGANARGMYRDDGFLVLKGSIARREDVPIAEANSPDRYQVRLIASGVVREEGEALVFEEDHLFRSPSMAATVLIGRTANGWVEWKNEQGVTLDTVARQQPANDSGETDTSATTAS
jgi:predicted type IV restriction endonuclease